MVEPPEAQTQAIAFSKDALVMILLAVRPFLTTIITRWAELFGPTLSLSVGWTAGNHLENHPADDPQGLRMRRAIVLAVNWPPQAPAPGLWRRPRAR